MACRFISPDASPRLSPRIREDSLSSDPQLCRLGNGLPSRFDSELSEDCGNVVIDGLLGEKQLGGDLAVAEAFAEKLQNLELPSGEPRRVFARRDARPEAHASDPPLAEDPRDPGARPCRTELLELGDAATQGLFAVGPRKGQGGLVWTAERAPQPCRPLHIARQLERERLRSRIDRDRVVDARSPSPGPQLPGRPLVGACERELEGNSGFLLDAIVLARKPARLCACGGNRRQPLELAGSRRQLPRFVEDAPHVGVTSSRMESSEHGERRDLARRGYSRMAYDGLCRVRSSLPIS